MLFGYPIQRTMYRSIHSHVIQDKSYELYSDVVVFETYNKYEVWIVFDA